MKYITPEVEVELFEAVDVICESPKTNSQDEVVTPGF